MRKVARKNMAAVGCLFTLIGLVLLSAVAWFFLDQHAYFCPVIRESRCAKNLDQIAAAKAMLQEERSLTNGTPVTADQLLEYVERGRKNLSCPAGGTYDVGPLGTPPVCSVHGGTPRQATTQGTLTPSR